MACSHCADPGHRIQRCPTVRRCGHCDRPGHDRRNCPKLHPVDPPRTRTTSPQALPREQPPAILAPDDLLWRHIARLREVLRHNSEILAHLYWVDREIHFDESRRRYDGGGPWRLVATPEHGVGKPKRPTLNFFVADAAWLAAYPAAAADRGLRHGLLVHRSALDQMQRRPDYELAEIQLGYPHAHGVRDAAEFWRFDIGNHRPRGVGPLNTATVVRFATPLDADARTVDIPHEAVLAVW